jgi:hypothetical protein
VYKAITKEDIANENTVYYEAIMLAEHLLYDIINNEKTWNKFKKLSWLSSGVFIKKCIEHVAGIQGGYFDRLSPEQIDYIKSFASNIIFFAFTGEEFRSIDAERENLKDKKFFVESITGDILSNLITFDKAYYRMNGKIDVEIKRR